MFGMLMIPSYLNLWLVKQSPSGFLLVFISLPCGKLENKEIKPGILRKLGVFKFYGLSGYETFLFLCF